jgi:signal transduction histidine kinase
VPISFAALAVAVHPVAWIAVAALVTVVPWLVFIADLPAPGWVCGVVSIGGVAWLMKDWPHSAIDLTQMILVYVVAMQAALLSVRGSVATLVLALGVPLGWALGSGYPRAPGWLIGMLFSWGCGFFFRKQHEALEQLQCAQHELADKAVSDERRRIAREVHDLVAHSLAVTMLHLTGARLALADGETAEAEAALASAEQLGRSSMTGIRQAVGLLTTSSDDINWAPEPDATDVPALVEDYRRAGVDVTLTSRGEAQPLEPAAGLAVFRLVQESLANAVQHAPGQSVSVELIWAPASLSLQVTNAVIGTASTARVGHGLVGMRERSDQLGAAFTAGASAGKWRVQMEHRLPARAEPEATPL